MQMAQGVDIQAYHKETLPHCFVHIAQKFVSNGPNDDC